MEESKKQVQSRPRNEDLSDDEFSSLSGGADSGVVTGEPGMSRGVVETSPRHPKEHFKYPSYGHL